VEHLSPRAEAHSTGPKSQVSAKHEIMTASYRTLEVVKVYAGAASS
jgi:hypothetical protein